jgi:hypothetical protein
MGHSTGGGPDGEAGLQFSALTFSRVQQSAGAGVLCAMSHNLRLALLLTVALLGLPDAAVADQNWKTNSAIWKQRDVCTTQAQKAYPDYTPESNAKRQKALDTCLRQSNLPVEGSSAPAPAPAPQK